MKSLLCTLFAILYFSLPLQAAGNYPGVIKNVNGSPTLFINGKRIFPMALRWLTGRHPGEKHFHTPDGVIEDFAGHGVKIVFCGTELGWRGIGKFDYSEIDRHIAKIIANKDVYIILSIDMRSMNYWFLKQFPDEQLILKKNGKLVPQPRVAGSYFSDKLRTHLGDALQRYIRHIEERNWASRVIGYQINWGQSNEWMPWSYNLADFNPHSLKALRTYLRKKYGNDVAKLRAAWKDDSVTFDNAEPPAKLVTYGDKDGFVIDPATGEKYPDCREVYRERITDTILYFTELAKKATKNRALIGLYAGQGYQWQKFGERISVSDSVDFGVSSSNYHNRGLNGVSLSQQLSMEAFRQNGKLYWHDVDSRTYLWPEGVYGLVEDVYSSIMCNRRDFGGAFTAGMGTTWFNLCLRRNIYRNRAIMKDISKLRAIASASIKSGCDFSSVAEVAVIYDCKSTLRTPYRSNAAQFTNYLKLGVPVEYFATEHLKFLLNRKSQFKVIILAGCTYLTADERACIQELRSGGRTVIFMYANGFAAENGFDIKQAEQLSGFTYNAFAVGADREVDITSPEWQKIFQKSFPLMGHLSPPSSARRVSVIPKNGDEVIGVSRVDGNAAFVMHKYSDHTTIQYPGSQIHPRIFRELIKAAGMKINYPYTDSTLQRCRNFISVTGGSGGRRQLFLPDTEVLYDIFSDRIIKPQNGIFEIVFLPYECKLLFSGKQTEAEKFRSIYQKEL